MINVIAESLWTLDAARDAFAGLPARDFRGHRRIGQSSRESRAEGTMREIAPTAHNFH